eukprot:COSAG04_NODE_6852_length_1241_cov_1.808231_1_plen_301_part_00
MAAVTGARPQRGGDPRALQDLDLKRVAASFDAAFRHKPPATTLALPSGARREGGGAAGMSSPTSSAFVLQRYGPDGELEPTGGPDAERPPLPPIRHPLPMRVGRVVRERRTIRHSEKRALRRSAALGRSPPGNHGQAQQAQRVALSSGFRRDQHSEKRRREVQHAREAMAWPAAQPTTPEGASGWQPAASSSKYLEEAAAAPESGAGKSGAQAEKSRTRRRGRKKGRRRSPKAGGADAEQVSEGISQAQLNSSWENFKLPALTEVAGRPEFSTSQEWAGRLAAQAANDADFSPWKELDDK